MTRRTKPDLAERRAIVVDILSQAVMALAVEQRAERDQRAGWRTTESEEQTRRVVDQSRDGSEHPDPRHRCGETEPSQP